MYKISWLLIIIFFGCNNKDETKPGYDSQTSIGLNEIKLSDLKDQEINLEQYKGKTVFINFWATWCRPCLEEMPHIQKTMEILEKSDIIFLFASNETTEQIINFRRKNNYNFNFVKVENLEELNIMALPTTFIFNTEGKLVFSEMGYRKWDDKENIDLILKNMK